MMILTYARARRWRAGWIAILAILVAPQIAGAQSTSLRGIITARDGAQMTVTTSDGATTVFTLTDRTKVSATVGALGVRENTQAVADLVGGLPVSVEGVRNGEETEAVRVTFKASDLKVALQIEAGTAQAKENAKAKLAEADAKTEALRKRLSEANQYVEKGEATVLFAVNSVALSDQAKADLQALATKALGIKGYLISVVGYADTTGNPEANQRLSVRRAAAVTNYVQKYCKVEPYRMLAHDAMGDAHQIGDAQSASGKAQNRRVVVKILTNKGLEGL